MDEPRDARGLTEAEAIVRYRSRNYPKPALTADIVVFAKEEGKLRVLLIRRKGHPFIGKLALPGGFANENEPVEQTAARELEEETGVKGVPMKLIDIFSQPGRDPRGWVVSAAYVAIVEAQKIHVQAGDDAAEALWYEIAPAEDGPVLSRNGSTIPLSDLAFDHEEVLRKALQLAGDCR